MFKKLSIPILAVLAGCATSANFAKQMDSFVGKPEIAVVSAYGAPDRSYAMQDGSRVIQYTKERQVALPGAVTTRPVRTTTTGNVSMNQGMTQTNGTYSQQSTTYVKQQGPGTNIEFSCTMIFTLDSSGTVKSWTSNGNDCKS